MFELLRTSQQNIILFLVGACAAITFLLLISRFLSPARKRILIMTVVTAALLLGFDLFTYKYDGDMSRTGYLMARLSNFLVFFLTDMVVLNAALYLADLMKNEGGMEQIPARLRFVVMLSMLGMLFVVLAHFSGFYYYFDEMNIYHRGPGFLFSYIIPLLGPLIMYLEVFRHRRILGKLIYRAFFLYIFAPILCGIIQIFTYGLSLTNMAIVLVSISMYAYTYLDINDKAMKSHEKEMEDLQREHRSMERLFDQTAGAFVSAVEKKDPFAQGHSARVAQYAKRMAELSGRSQQECENIYYAALLHDVGMIGIPDSVLGNKGKLSEEEYAVLKQKPVIGGEILSSITEYPYLSLAARYSCERYDGKGYPEGLKGDEIPEVARIVAAASAYDDMAVKNRSHDTMPYQIMREEFVKGSGLQFDPEMARIAVNMIDADYSAALEETRSGDSLPELTTLVCGKYRDTVSEGYGLSEEIIKIRFSCRAEDGENAVFSDPAIILFDAYDRRVHTDIRAIEEYRYLEYGELWFDGHSILTGARNMQIKVREGSTISREPDPAAGKAWYQITAGRYEDHLKLKLETVMRTVDVIVALQDSTKTAYIGLTGEHCLIGDIKAEKTKEKLKEGDISRIAEKISYIDRMESDLPNVQIDRTCSAATEGVGISDGLRIAFHSMSLPTASLVWHCPYVLLYFSEDKKVRGKGYREYALIKLNGEIEQREGGAENRFSMKRMDSFPGWDRWKEICRAGMECELLFRRKGNRVTMFTENLGVHIENTTLLPGEEQVLYMALTGDQVALTDIRVN